MCEFNLCTAYLAVNFHSVWRNVIAGIILRVCHAIYLLKVCICLVADSMGIFQKLVYIVQLNHAFRIEDTPEAILLAYHTIVILNSFVCCLIHISECLLVSQIHLLVHVKVLHSEEVAIYVMKELASEGLTIFDKFIFSTLYIQFCRYRNNSFCCLAVIVCTCTSINHSAVRLRCIIIHPAFFRLTDIFLYNYCIERLLVFCSLELFWGQSLWTNDILYTS